MPQLTRLWRILRRLAGHLIHFRFAAIGGEIKTALRRLRETAHRRQNRRALRAALAGKADGRRVIVFPPTLDWHLPLYQRPQQLARAYSRKENTLVLYLTANNAHDRVDAAQALGDSLYLVNASLARELSALLRGASETVVSLSWTANRRYLELLRPDRVIYEYIDELEIFDGYDAAMRRDHAWLLRRADLTVCTAQSLYEKARSTARRAIYSPNAGDYAFFSRTASAVPDARAAQAAANYSAVLGYYGALAAWFDYPLLSAAADQRPDWLFLLIGMDYDGSLAKSGLLTRPNVLWIPPQPYERLPSYLRLFDVALIPFRLSEITRSTSPVKLFEYMAAEKPILSARLRECLRYPCVETYADETEFLAKAASLLARKDDPALKAALRDEALRNTWDARTDEILAALARTREDEPTKGYPLIQTKTIPG